MTTLAADVHTLNTLLPNLPTFRLSFAVDLVSRYNKTGKLSPAQAEWVPKLITIANNPPQKTQIALGIDLSGLISTFNKAKSHLKFPKIVMMVDGKKVIFSMAGPKAKAPGSINVASGSFNNGEWYGRVTLDGMWEPGAAGKAMGQSLVDVIQMLATDPAGTAAQYGKMTGSCCFCNAALTDPKSVNVGYGPVCADHFGLPWGN